MRYFHSKKGAALYAKEIVMSLPSGYVLTMTIEPDESGGFYAFSVTSSVSEDGRKKTSPPSVE